MKRSILVAGVGAGLLAAGVVAGRLAGSRPDGAGVEGPLPPCGPSANCFRTRQAFSASPEAVREAASEAVRQSESWFTGRAVRLTPTERGLEAVFKVGSFRDDVAVVVEPADGGGSVLYLRSASRVGESDLGVNRARARRIVRDVAERLSA